MRIAMVGGRLTQLSKTHGSMGAHDITIILPTLEIFYEEPEAKMRYSFVG